MKNADSNSNVGHYAKKQLLCRSGLIRWSHASRFRLARQLVAGRSGGRLLDYGCGDGTFLGLTTDLFPDAVGTDCDGPQTDDCASRYAASGLTFIHTSQLTSHHDHRYDAIVCMETLEHCLPSARDFVLGDLARLCQPQGIVIISVPIEVGIVLPLKQMARRIAGWRKLGDYATNERYSWSELARMTFATERTEIERPVYNSVPSQPLSGSHGHKGFNWRRLRMEIRQHLNIDQTHFSPMGWSRGFLSSQAWFVCSPR